MEISVRSTAVALIVGYQRWISPHKGYSCAHSAYHGGVSCSEWGRRAVLRTGVIQSIPLLVRRLKACRQAYNYLSEDSGESPAKKKLEGDEPESCPCLGMETAMCCGSFWPFFGPSS